MNDFVRRAVAKIQQTALTLRWRRRKGAGQILMLHSVGGSESEFNISAEAFGRLLEALSHRNCIRLEDWENAAGEFYALTFDDVPANFYTTAWPMLERHEIPFTIFVNLDCLDSDGYITTAQLREIAASRFATIGSHGVSHGLLRNLTEKEADEDLRVSKERLAEITGRDVSLLAFPFGSVYACGLRLPQLALKHYRYAFSTVGSHISSGLPHYFLPRINVTENFELCH